MQVQVSLTLEVSATTGLADLEEAIVTQGRQSMCRALQQAIRQWEQRQRRCPRCKNDDVRVEGTVGRRVLLVFGRVRLALRRYRCQHCLHRWCPARHLLRDLRGQQVSPGLREAAVLAGSSWPYRHATQLLERLSGAQISAEELRQLTMQQGEQQACVQQQHAEQVLNAAPNEGKGEAGVVGMDGGWTHSCEQAGGMEGKVAVVACNKQVQEPKAQPDPSQLTWYELAKRSAKGKRLGPVHQRARWMKRCYVATFAPSKALGILAEAAAREVGLDQAKSVVVADGAQWIKQEAKQHFAKATHILDWFHLWRVVRKAIRETQRDQQYPETWLTEQITEIKSWLWHGEVDQAVKRLQSWQEKGEGKALKAAVTYLQEQREWIGSYEAWRQAGYPVGSGIIERAVSLVINRRMKRRGMRWKRDNATALVTLRTDFLNADWQRHPSHRAFV
ncbi:hypothetical protein KSD_65890 [Ktedonobacter sp. SOSP1-85]|uniref:ISKra4 family transposase n=1 Tax=Ktedonobacter sp. SOSP1-85 TaxID=2778367 RepID=UPI001915B66E|nr:ISKra4 family transposase [Ktedonobacter sp. SOSP1-85]GHO78818.1 hypothetical protein KSD_65890 [Ktedonobacter sp. SOSP1-85]